jgi:hypothetical protein
VEVYNLGLRPALGGQYVPAAPHPRDLAAADRSRLVDPESGIDRQDLAVVKDEVGPGPCQPAG